MPPRQAPPTGGNNNLEGTVVDIGIAVIILILVIGIFRTLATSVFGSYLGVITWFYSGSWTTFYIVITILISIINAGLLYLAIIFAKRYYDVQKEAPQKEIESRVASPQEEFLRNWQEIQSLAASVNGSDWNMAILRADAQLDDTLGHLGYEGDTIAERLKIVDPTKLTSMDRVWSAHRLRNTIAHDPLQVYTREMIAHALDSYRLAFEELGFLQNIPVEQASSTLPIFPEAENTLPMQ